MRIRLNKRMRATIEREREKEKKNTPSWKNWTLAKSNVFFFFRAYTKRIVVITRHTHTHIIWEKGWPKKEEKEDWNIY